MNKNSFLANKYFNYLSKEFVFFMAYAKKLTIKEFLKISLSLIPIILSIISLRQSSLSLANQNESLAVKIQVFAKEKEDAIVMFIPFPDGDFSPFPGTYGFIKLPIEIRIDNLSLRKVSILEIDATPILEDPDTKEMTSFFTNGIAISTNFTKPLRNITNGNIININFPITLDQGESILLEGDVGWPLDRATSDLLTQNMQSVDKTISLYDLKILLAKNNKTLSRASIELEKDKNGTPMPFPVSIERSKLIYRIDVFTSFNTRHKTYLDLNPSLFIEHSNWDLLIVDDEEGINNLLGK